MIVTFISECQKNSLKLTRQVLDAYAHRIGQRTWQTTITEQGLQAVRARLGKTARKSTAVACHRIIGTRRSQLLWIVGDKSAFDATGNVAVNYTSRDILKLDVENDWRYLPLLQAIVAVASLFHDFGKAWVPFQKCLDAAAKKNSNVKDPWRHEWVSVLLFQAYINGRDDDSWLTELAGISELNNDHLLKLSKETIERAEGLVGKTTPIAAMDTTWLVRSIIWLIVSHHRIPYFKDITSFGSESDLVKQINEQWGYVKAMADAFDTKKHWKFQFGLPFLSKGWRSSASRWGRKLNTSFSQLKVDEVVACQRILLTLGRTLPVPTLKREILCTVLCFNPGFSGL